jgi:hypothetical protein
MNLSPEVVAAYKKLMTEPKENGLDFQPLQELFEETKVATAKHLLYEQYLTKINKTKDQLPKVFFYIIMDEMYQQKKDEDGCLGYCAVCRQ